MLIYDNHFLKSRMSSRCSSSFAAAADAKWSPWAPAGSTPLYTSPGTFGNSATFVANPTQSAINHAFNQGAITAAERNWVMNGRPGLR